MSYIKKNKLFNLTNDALISISERHFGVFIAMPKFQFISKQKSISQNSGEPKCSVSIFADSANVRQQTEIDAETAGFKVVEASGLTALHDKQARPLGKIVLFDCRNIDQTILTSLVQIDRRAANSGAALIVSTNVAALEDVFGCLDQSDPRILIDASRTERLMAMGEALARRPDTQMRELSESDRLVLLRLTEQVNQIAERMEYFSGSDTKAVHGLNIKPRHGGEEPGAASAYSSAFQFSSQSGLSQSEGDRLILEAPQSLPEAKLIRQIIKQRQLRARFFDSDLFADPAWDILLDLTVARAENSRVSVTSLCIASGVPPTTALRWISQMTDAGQHQRNEDKTDRRRAFISLSEKATDAMTRYFIQIAGSANQMV